MMRLKFIMSNSNKTYTVTKEKYQEGLSKGWTDDDMLKPGTYAVRRSKHITPLNEQKIKITIYLDADIIDFFKQRAKEPNASPYQTQINNELRAIIEQTEDKPITISMLENPVFISALAEKLKAA
jgi:uncharacterized protein (DUF4415 family)